MGTTVETVNQRAVAELFKIELSEMFNAWGASAPLRTGAPHASAILAGEADWCVRRHTLLAMHAEQAQRPDLKPWDAHKFAIFLSGWGLHEKYQELLKRFGTVLEVETSHYDETRFLHFTPDAIIEFSGLPHVVEIKGYKAETFEALDEAGDPPRDAHKQCNLYCHLLGIPQGLILVENKNNQEYKVWAIQCDPELARAYTERMYAVKGAITRATHGKGLAERKCVHQQESRAQACPMRTLCFSR